MVEVEELLMPIDLRLRFALFGLECALGVFFPLPEVDRVFRDAVLDQISAKEYEFFQSPRLRVSGRVDEYEPETFRLRVEGHGGVKQVVKGVAQRAEAYAALIHLPH